MLNKQPGLSGMVSNDKHLPVPYENFPRDERFFGNGVNVAEIRKIRVRPGWYTIHLILMRMKGYVAMPNINVVEGDDRYDSCNQGL